jgi:MYXO-CTERM domain-containing protein
MRDEREITDAATTTGRGDARRVGKGAIALLAIGAPFAAATPANADGNGHASSGAGAPVIAFAGAAALAAGALLRRRLDGASR